MKTINTKKANAMTSRLLVAAFVGATLAVAAEPTSAQAVKAQPLMGDPIDGLTVSELDRFDKGKVAFSKEFTDAEGLGPVMNDIACSACHSIPAIGGSNVKFVTRFGKAASGGDPFDPLDDLGGSLKQELFIDPLCQEFVPPEADVEIHRLTPHTLGAGLVEAIADADLYLNQDFPPNPNVSGEAHEVTPLEGGPETVGRFGWKAQVPTMLTFSGDAFLNEMGITNRLVMDENKPNGDAALLDLCDDVDDPEDFADGEGFEFIDRMTDFQRFLAPPAQTPRSGMTGAGVFDSVGCSACHVASFTSGVTAEAALSNKPLKPYSDFLLHDLGGLLGDGIVQGEGTEQEMRTAPLWGMAFRNELLHDGRATGGTFKDNLESAIGWHGGEGDFARQAYFNLSPAEQDQLVAFMGSLGQAEFDYEFDNDRDEFDWFFYEFDGLFTGPGSFYTPDDFGSTADVDQDGDFDMEDWAAFQAAFTGSI